MLRKKSSSRYMHLLNGIHNNIHYLKRVQDAICSVGYKDIKNRATILDNYCTLILLTPILPVITTIRIPSALFLHWHLTSLTK